MRFGVLFAAAVVSLIAPTAEAVAADSDNRPNVVIFVADGLRAGAVDRDSAPNMVALACKGVRFSNSHALFPTFTMANAAALSTGHFLGDTGLFSNTIYAGFKSPAANDSITPFLEKNTTLADMDDHFGGNFLNEPSLFELARAAGYVTASIGKIGPTALFDHSLPDESIIIDDATGTPRGIPLADGIIDGLNAAALPLTAPTRGENGKSSGTKSANLLQQDYFSAAATRVVLPALVGRNKPFIMVFWSRDPDGSQHYQADSIPSLVPGINGPTSRAAIRNADDNLGHIRAALAELGIAGKTNIVVVADHGFSTVTKTITDKDKKSFATTDLPDGTGRTLPPGFLAIDLAKGLNMKLFDPDRRNAPVPDGSNPRFDNGIIGDDADHPKLVVAANGGSDLIYIPKKDGEPVSDEDKKLARQVVGLLLEQDYISGIFVRSDLGKIDGALQMSDIKLEGSATTPKPAIVVSFSSFDTSCGKPSMCAAEVADTTLKQGQGMHGSFSRADTSNYMAAAGPDFKIGFVDEAPASNADIARTIAAILKLKTMDKGPNVGRALSEALPGGAMPEVERYVLTSEAGGTEGLRTVLYAQKVGDTPYFDAGGFPGRTVGLGDNPPPQPDENAKLCAAPSP